MEYAKYKDVNLIQAISVKNANLNAMIKILRLEDVFTEIVMIGIMIIVWFVNKDLRGIVMEFVNKSVNKDVQVVYNSNQ